MAPTPHDPENPHKVSKASVDYRKADSLSRCCGNCDMYIPSGSCNLVAGYIDANDVCIRWVAR